MGDGQVWIEYAVIGGYLAFLVAVGLVLRRFNSNVSDYFRAGAKGKWWLVGASAFMGAFSAWTFTGAAGAAYESGWSILVIFFANVVAFSVHAAVLAPWFRQLRAITAPEVIRMRFGPVTQQVYAWLYAVLGLLYASIWLWGLAIFIAAVFDFSAPAELIGMREVPFVILVTGTVVLLYSVTGGSWAVMATDVLQSLILIPLTLVVAYLCLREVGGVAGMFQGIKDAGLTEHFGIVTPPGEHNPDQTHPDYWKYTAQFAFAAIIYKTVTFSTIDVAQKYFGVKNGKEARYAALLAGGLMLAGMAFWFIPPIVTRLLWSEDIALIDMRKPAEAAYAVAGLKVLPVGLIGLMVVAMLSATMSSMDSGLNKNAAVFTRDIYPLFTKILGLKEPGPRTDYLLGQITSVALGLIIILIALYFAAQEQGRGVFEAMLNVGAMLALPMAIPLCLSLFFRRVPAWAAMATVLITLVPSAVSFGAGKGWWAHLLGDERTAQLSTTAASWLAAGWPYHRTVLLNLALGSAAFFATMPFWRTAPTAYRKQVDEFFTRMHTPIDFEREVGQANDDRQLRVIGSFATIMGGFIALLAALPVEANDTTDRVAILFVGGFITTVGLLFLHASKASARKVAEAAQASRDEDAALARKAQADQEASR
jgi:SSS family solute:Na+ symporter